MATNCNTSWTGCFAIKARTCDVQKNIPIIVANFSQRNTLVPVNLTIGNRIDRITPWMTMVRNPRAKLGSPPMVRLTGASRPGLVNHAWGHAGRALDLELDRPC